jgi:transcriptional regulator with XRE-family HTH domain
MKDTVPDLAARIAARVRELRAGADLPIAALAARSGVSRSMISLIERGESGATAVVLAKLATALGVPLSALFDPPTRTAPEGGLVPVHAAAPSPRKRKAGAVAGTRAGTLAPLSRAADQPRWRDPASGYVRRNVTPPGTGQPMSIVEVRFPPGARVAFENGAADVRVHQQVWLLAGAMDVTVGEQRHRLRQGDCLAMQLDEPTMFHNPTRKVARYAVVVAADPGRRP